MSEILACLLGAIGGIVALLVLYLWMRRGPSVDPAALVADAPERIVEATLSASAAGRYGDTRDDAGPSVAELYEQAMSKAVTDCLKHKITDPNAIRQAQLDAKERMKAKLRQMGRVS